MLTRPLMDRLMYFSGSLFLRIFSTRFYFQKAVFSNNNNSYEEEEEEV
jgi:hypothetical protein